MLPGGQKDYEDACSTMQVPKTGVFFTSIGSQEVMLSRDARGEIRSIDVSAAPTGSCPLRCRSRAARPSWHEVCLPTCLGECARSEFGECARSEFAVTPEADG